MQINNNISNSPNFQARLLVNKPQVQSYIHSSFIADKKQTIDVLNKFNDSHRDTVVLMTYKNVKNKNYLVARNGINGSEVSKLLHDKEGIGAKDKTAFLDLIKKLLRNNDFWK